MNRTRLTAFFMSLIFLFMAGCDKKDNPTDSTSSTTYVGAFVSNLAVDTSAALIVLTINSSGTASGIVKIYDGALTTLTLSGTLSGTSLAITASDGTPVTGTLNGNTITGVVNNGDGTYSITAVTTPVTVETFSGTYQSTSGPAESGQLIICTAATTAWGVVIQSGARPDHLIGTISGSTVSIHDSHGSTQVASGTRSGNAWSGTYTGDTSSGTWSVTLVP